MNASSTLYLDTSVILRAVIETGLTPDVDEKLAGAAVLITSRLTHVECARALSRLRATHAAPEVRLADATRDVNSVLARCETWELTEAVCRIASEVAPHSALRTLDALHLATFLHAREIFADIELLTVDERLRAAAYS